jgi:hypothetical protein
MDIGRNDPCPCGSARKYKRCCGVAKTDPLELAAGEIRTAEEAAVRKIGRYLLEEIGEQAPDEAWDEFEVTEGRLTPHEDEATLFGPWMFYDWEPWVDERPLRRRSNARLTPAFMTMVECGEDLSPSERDFLTRVMVTPTSFHDVIACERGRSLTLRDIYLGDELTVLDKLAAADARVGDIIYARAVDFDDFGLLVGSGQLVMPAGHKGFLLDARKEIGKRRQKLTSQLLCEEEFKLRYSYLLVREMIVNPPRPQMTNTDGHPMEFHTLTYRIEDPEAALRALVPLANGHDPEQLVATAKRDWRGRLRGASFPWSRPGSKAHGGVPNTTLADFTVNGTILTAQVNSVERAKAVRAEIVKRLGTNASFVRDDAEPLDAPPTKSRSKREDARARVARQRDEELQALPEIQAMLAKYNADHYATWPDIPLPALKGKTPRAAMKTADGRERVEALILDFERSQDDGRASTPHYDFNLLRAALGLPLTKT